MELKDKSKIYIKRGIDMEIIVPCAILKDNKILKLDYLKVLGFNKRS